MMNYGLDVITRNLVAPASDDDGRVCKAVSPVKTRRNHWSDAVSLVSADVGSNPTRNSVFLIIDLAYNKTLVQFVD